MPPANSTSAAGAAQEARWLRNSKLAYACFALFAAALDRMERAGMVRRERSTADRRGVTAMITTDGLEELAKAAPVHRDGIQRWFTASLTDHEADVLAHVLGRIHASARDELHRRRLSPRLRR